MSQSATQWDVLFRNATVFDGTDRPPVRMDVAVSNGRIAAKGRELPAQMAGEVVDVDGKWLMPGLLDVHTHFDLEVEIAPGLPEAVRHGSTTVVVSNCSLGIAYGAQKTADQNPIVDCFARVENMPKHVLEKVVDRIDWSDSGDYLDHFRNLPLGPNVVPMIPHSMLRIEVMGLQDSISREPTAAELDRMEQLVEKGMQEGYIGFSTDSLPFHFLANDPHRRERIPTQFASYKELKRLTSVLRKHDRVWQATPEKDSRYKIFRNFLLTSGRLFGKPLKVTAVAAIDVATNRSVVRMGLLLSKILNSKLIRGVFRLQALSSEFKVWSDGALTPLSEEVPELRALNEPDLEDREARMAILRDPAYRQRFRNMWHEGKSGWSLAAIKRRLRIEDNVLSRRLDEMTIDNCPVPDWSGESMQSIYDRLLRYRGGEQSAARSDDEIEAFDAFPKDMQDDADFFLHLLEAYDTDLRWVFISANRDPAVVKELLFNPHILPGFNDSGAHLTNMAFYDGNLRTLKIAQADGLEKVAKAIRRMTAEPAAFFGLNTGSLEIGAQADITVVDPDKLSQWDWDSTIERVYREEFEHEQLVNRSVGICTHTMIAGKLAWAAGDFTPAFGEQRFGRAMRHQSCEPEAEQDAALQLAA